MGVIRIGGLAAALALGLAAPVGQAQPAPAQGDCDRQCLLGLLTTYTEALTDNDPAAVPVAPGLRVTANGAETRLGGGEVWGRIKRIAFREAFVDPQTGAAVFMGTLTNTPTREAEHWWFFTVRLKVVHKKVAEVEEIAFDGTLGGTPASSLHNPDRIYDTLLPPEERVSRERLFEIANTYFDAVSHRIDYHKAPWHPECQRIELGVFTVNSALQAGSCGGEFKTPSVKWNVENRRFYIADEQRGVVLAVGNFMTPPEYPNNNGSVVFEVFKVQDGMIRHIEAFFRGDGQLHSGWGEGLGK